MSLYLGENLISGVATPVEPTRNIGQIITSTIPLTDAGLHLLDGALIQGSGSYSAFVDYIAGLVADYPDLFDTEANWQSAVTQYGVCGKFVYNSVNNTVRLPKITGIVEGTTNVTALGNLVQAGLPNITGSVGRGNSTNGIYVSGNGAFSVSDVGSTYIQTGGASQNDVYKTFSINASRSSSIYGNSTTVQPQTIKVLYYIVVATSTKTDIEVDIDEIATDLNGKVNKSGDTMTGNLKISKETNSATLNLQRNDCAIGDVATGNQINVGSLSCYDRNNNNMSIIQTRIGTDGSTGIQLALRKHDLSSYNSVLFSTLPDGSAFFDFPKCTTQATTTSTASSAKVAVIIKNYVNGGSWYRIWSDGWCEQGGLTSVTGSGTTISFTKTFINTNFNFVATAISGDGTWTGVYIYSKTASNIQLRLNSSNYTKTCSWKASGYLAIGQY